MAQSGIQLYTLRNADESLPALLERVADAGFEGVEFAYRIYDADPEAIRRTLDETGLDAASAHVPIERLEDDTEATVDLFRSFGVETLTVPSLDEDCFQSRAAVEEAADRLESIADELNTYDLDLGYHNHTHEFVDLDGQFALEVLFEETGGDVRPQIDVCHAARAGAEPVALLRRLGDVRQVHVADADLESSTPVAIGEGDLDFDAISTAFHEVGGEWAFYEYEDDDPLATLDKGASDVSSFCMR